MLKYILALLLLLPSQVWGGVFVGFGQVSIVQLAGNSTLTTTREYAGGGGQYSVHQTFTASASGTLEKGYGSVYNQTATKLCVWDGGTGAVIECSSPVTPSSSDLNTDVEFDFAGTTSILSGTSYSLGFVRNGYPSIAVDNNNYIARTIANNYASPGSVSGAGDAGGLGNLRIWITN